MGVFRSTAIRFTWPRLDLEELLERIDGALGGEVGEWNDDGGELMGIAGLATADGLNLASYWKAGFFSPVEPIGLTIDRYQTAGGAELLGVVAMVPPAGSPLAKGKQGLTQIAQMSGATWVPFEGMGIANLQIDFLNPR